uniref:Uncharacterized protein n=1 Tax=uncultured Acidobacteriota bacterium TaxID=171953 RepID=F2YWV4_9BACT|nr:hypothetical protein Lip018_ORF003 [uncultured Acidobacteriota bacterium]
MTELHARTLAIVLALLPAGAHAAADVPYSLQLDAFSIAGFPGVQSGVVAGTPERLVVLGGRISGLHGFPSNRNTASSPSFPLDARNSMVYVLDLTQKKLLGKAKTDALPAAIAAQITANNTEYLLKDGWLYIVGGYGLAGPVNTSNPSLTPLRTLPSAIAIDFQALTSTVIAGGSLDTAFAAANIASATDPNLAVTGGDLKFLGNHYLLVFGHRMDGLYTTGGGTISQQYTSAVRVFNIQAAHNGTAAQLTINFIQSVPNNPGGVDPSKDPYHRRDLPVEGYINAQGQMGIAAYGGVFKPGQFDGYLEPVYIDAASSAPGIMVRADNSAAQVLSQYDGAAIPAYSASSKSMYTTFFGSISEYYWSGGKLHHDTPNLNIVPPIDGLPFINSVSTLKRTYSGSKPATAQFVHNGQTFAPSGAIPQCAVAGGGTVAAPLAGAETRFVPADSVPRYENDVIKLDQVKSKTAVGYLIGGIAADKPYPENTCVLNQIYEISLDPKTATSTTKLKKP